MKKNLLYVGGFELPDKNAAAHRVHANSKILVKLGYEVVFAGISHNTRLSDELLSTKSKGKIGLEYQIRYPVSKREWLHYLWSVRGIKRIIEREDITLVVAYNFPAVALYKLRIFCKARNIPLLADCTEWEVSNRGSFLFKIIKGLDTYLRMRVIHPMLDGILAISTFLYDFYFPLNKHVILLPPLVDKLEKKWKTKFEWEYDSTPVLTFAGSLGNEKDDLNLLIESLKEIKMNLGLKFRLNVVGLTYEEYLNNKSNKALPSEIRTDVVFHGRLSNQEVIWVLQKSHYSIFIRDTNRKTKAGFPTKFVESIAAGTPVLTNESSDLRDYLIDGKNGFFLDTSSKENFVESLRKVLSHDGTSYEELKHNCESNEDFDFRKHVGIFNQFLIEITH